MSYEDDMDDVYKEGVAEVMLDDGELTAEEEAFLLGYNEAFSEEPDYGEV